MKEIMERDKIEVAQRNEFFVGTAKQISGRINFNILLD